MGVGVGTAVLQFNHPNILISFKKADIFGCLPNEVEESHDVRIMSCQSPALLQIASLHHRFAAIQ